MITKEPSPYLLRRYGVSATKGLHRVIVCRKSIKLGYMTISPFADSMLFIILNVKFQNSGDKDKGFF